MEFAMGNENICVKCGASSTDSTWCEECGAPLVFDDNGPKSIVRDVIIVKTRQQKNIELEITEVLEKYSGHQAMLATVLASECEKIKINQLYLVEETRGEEGQAFNIPEKLFPYFRNPIAFGKGKGNTYRVYNHRSGLNLAELVSLANGDLSFSQIEILFSSICDTVEKVHQLDALVLAISPWTVRVFGESLKDRFTKIERSTKSEVVPTLEHEIDDAEVERIIDDEDYDPMIATRSDESGFGTESYDILFEGIDFVVNINDEPEEVPVIIGFSAPEFFGSYTQALHENCDVFALGMILYFLAAARIPPSSVYSRYCPAFGFHAFRKNFPPGLQAVISKATSPSPEERYQNIEELKAAFKHAVTKSKKRMRLSGEPIPNPTFMSAVETHIGISKRRRNPTNQDAVFEGVSDDNAFSFIVVADGVSTASYGTGDRASHYITEAAAEEWEDLLPKYLLDDEIDPVATIKRVLEVANQRLVAYVNENFPNFTGNPHEVMGSTVLLSIYYRGMMTIASLGDSRIYLHDELGFEQLTIDHNLWTLSIIEGVPPESAMNISHGEALAKCVGTFQIEKGKLNAIPPMPDFYKFVVLPGDTVLMTTDGLVDYAGSNHFESELRIKDILDHGQIPDIQCLEFVMLANLGGGGDNIGIAVQQFFEKPSTS